MLGMASIEYQQIDRIHSTFGANRVEWTITSSSGGGTGGSVEGCGSTTKELVGYLDRIAVFPHKTLNPTTAFDLYLYDLSASRDAAGIRQYGSLDILDGKGVDNLNSAPSQISLASEPLIAGKVSLVAYNMGVLKKAKIIAYIKK